MGFLGGDNDNEPTRADQLAEEQLAENKAELENKKHRLYQTRLGILRGQGAQQWTPTKETPGLINGRQAGRLSESDVAGVASRIALRGRG